jgi:hypothetical protein
MYAEAGHESLAVFFNGLYSDGKVERSLFIGISFCDELQNLFLAWRQLFCCCGGRRIASGFL